MSTAPLQSSSFNPQTQTRLAQINAPSNDQALSKAEFIKAVDTDGDEQLSDAEISTSGIHTDDVQAITTAYKAHGSDPTSALVSFGQPAATAEVPVEPVAEPAAEPVEPVTPAELPPLQLTPLADAQGLTQPRNVLKGPELEARLGELETQTDEGLRMLGERKTALEGQQPAPADLTERLAAIDQAVTKLTELKALLGRRSEPEAVQTLQQFLIDNDNGTQSEESFQNRLTYQTSGGQSASVDNLYGARTDSGLRDFVSRLVQETRVGGPHAKPVTPTEPAPETVPETVPPETETVQQPATVVEGETPAAVTPTFSYGALPSFVPPTFSYGANPSLNPGALDLTMPSLTSPRFGTSLFNPDIYQPRLGFGADIPGSLGSYSTVPGGFLSRPGSGIDLNLPIYNYQFPPTTTGQ